MTSRSPYLLSVLNMGASVLTSHRYLQYSVQCSTVQYSTGQYSAVQYLPVLATLSCARWRCVALLRLVSMLTPGRANTATAGLLEGR